MNAVGVSKRAGEFAQQIADWLKQLGIPEYTERFAENGIDVSVLRDLTDQDLKDIGVLLGHRRKILRAIGELSSAAPLKTEPAVGTEPKVQDAAERRQARQELRRLWRCSRSGRW
jgi:hypothetical protein